MRYWTPLFLKAEPPTTGTNWLVDGQAADALLELDGRGRLFLEEERADFLVVVGDGFDRVPCSDFSASVLQFGRDVDELVGRADLVVVGIDERPSG